MNNEQQYLINILKHLLHEDDNLPSNNSDIDFDLVYRIAKHNSVANMAAYLISKDLSISADVRQKFEKERMQIIMQRIKQEAVISELKEIFDSNEKRGVILKGSIIKDFYPVQYMRSMSDIDFFMEEKDIKDIAGDIAQNGYMADLQGLGSHYTYIKYDVVHVELHSDIEPINSSYGKNVFQPRFPDATSIEEEMDLWSHTIPFKGSNYMVQLTPEYHYAYMIMHAMRHFMSSGTGIRSIMDVWVMNNHYAKKWDRDMLATLLEKFGMARFEKYAVALADRWFDLHDTVSVAPELDDDTLDAFESFIFGSGTYGNIDNGVVARMGHETNIRSKLAFLLKAFFLSYEYMKHQYPVLGKAPILLPVMWVYRVFDVFHKRGASAKHKLHSVVNADEKKAQTQKEMLDELLRQ